MNHKTIRAYQFKADEAVRTLEEAGAQWVVGKGKPHWELPIEPKLDVEEVKRQQSLEFAKIIDKNFIGMCRELFGEPQAEAPKEIPAVDSFEMGPTQFPDRGRYVGKTVVIKRIPSWHRLERRFIGQSARADSIEFITKSNYKGYVVMLRIGCASVWLPVSCVEFRL